MLYCYIPKLMLMYEDLENIKADLVNTVSRFQLTSKDVFLGTLGTIKNQNED